LNILIIYEKEKLKWKKKKTKTSCFSYVMPILCLDMSVRCLYSANVVMGSAGL